MSGGIIRRHPIDPPRVNLRPTYSLVVGFDSPTAGSETFITAGDLISTLAKQLNIAQSADRINVRVQSIKCWAYQLAGKDDRVAISLDVSSLIPTIEDASAEPIVAVNYPLICRLSDFGTFSSPAFVGYTWPRTHQQVPLHSNSNFQIAAVAANTKNATIHVHVLWNTTDVAPPPS